jgi:A/G-specific adenine glycosylase
MAERSRRKAAAGKNSAVSGALLGWYDRNARVLPWRARPGAFADPYRVWLSEIMLQQTRVETVLRYFARFLARWPDVGALAAADRAEVLSEWAGLGYYARARNLHACAMAVMRDHEGVFPGSEAELRRLPGIGAYTAAAIAAIAFGKRASPMDGNIERVVSRLFAFEGELPSAKKDLARLAAELTPAGRPGDFAQAMMDLGATICTPRNPACGLCPLFEICEAGRRGDPESFPRKRRKREGEMRRGAVFVLWRGDALLLRTRQETGLLGGMSEVPGSEWSAVFDPEDRTAAPLSGVAWRRIAGTVLHGFTHFPLELVVYAGEVPSGTRAPRGMRFVPRAALGREALPSLMRKVIAHASAAPMTKKTRKGDGDEHSTDRARPAHEPGGRA